MFNLELTDEEKMELLIILKFRLTALDDWGDMLRKKYKNEDDEDYLLEKSVNDNKRKLLLSISHKLGVGK